MGNVKKTVLLRERTSWDGAVLPDYPSGKPEIVCVRHEFPAGERLPLHHHPVINFGLVEKGELTVISVDGREKVIKAGEPLVEMVDTVHYGENRGTETVILTMFYLTSGVEPVSIAD